MRIVGHYFGAIIQMSIEIVEVINSTDEKGNNSSLKNNSISLGSIFAAIYVFPAEVKGISALSHLLENKMLNSMTIGNFDVAFYYLHFTNSQRKLPIFR